MDQKTMVQLHNGILHSRRKQGAPTLCDSMDGTGEHYAIHYSIHALKRVYCIMNDIFRAYINKWCVSYSCTDCKFLTDLSF